MRKYILLFLSFIVSFPLLASVPASGNTVASVSGKATATVVLDYRNDFARIGFTSAKVDTNDFSAKSEISEAALVKDTSSRDASSKGTAIWSFWQINNTGEYTVKLSSNGIKSSDGQPIVYDKWNVAIDGTLGLSGNKDNKESAVVLKKKTGTQSESGSCSLVITVLDYPSLPADNYVLPLVLTLESV